MPSNMGKRKLSLFSRFRKHKKNKNDLINKTGKTNEDCVELNWMVQSDPDTRCNPPCGFDCLICLAERGVFKEVICNQRPVAVVLPTRWQTNTVTVDEMNSLEVDESTVVDIDESTVVDVDESIVLDVDESMVNNIDDNTVVKTAEDDHLCAADGLSDIQPNLESQFNPEFEDTSVKDLDWANIISSRSLENNVPDDPYLQERDNTAFEESNLNCYSCFNTAGEETVQETDNVRIVSRNDNYFENQKSGNENKKEVVTEIQMFGQTNTQHKDVQDSHLVHEDNIRLPQESGHSPHSVQVATPHEGRNALHQDQMFTQLHRDMNCSNRHDMPDSCITNTTVAKLVEKVDHLESMIDRLSRLVLLALGSNSRIPDSVKKQDLVISECQENCKACFNDDDIISPIEENLIQGTFLTADSFIDSDNQHGSSACVCLVSRTFDLGSHQYDRRQVSPPFILAEAMNSTSSASMGQEIAEKTEKMQKVSKDFKICEPANQLMTMSMVNRPLWDTGPESDEIGHTLSIQMNPSEENLEHNLDLQKNLEGQAVLKKINPSKAGRNCSILEEMITVEKDNGENHGLDSLKGSNEEMNLIENKSRCLSDAILTQSVNMEHTNMASLENFDNDEQLDMATKSTTKGVRAVDSLACSRKDYTDTGIMPMVDDKPTFINSDADVPCGRDSVKDQVWNKLNLETDEMLVSTSKFSMEAAHHCSSTDILGEGFLNQIEDVMGLSSSVLKVKEIDCCQNVDATTLSCVGQMDSNINVCTVKMDPSEFSPEVDPDISDPDHIPDENAVSTSKLTLEAADNTDNSKETDCCPNANTNDVSCLHQIYGNIDPIKTNPFKFFPEMDPVISGPEYIPGHGLSTQYEECQQREALVCYYCDHSLQVQHSCKEKFTRESQSIQDSEPDKPGANESVSGSKVQEGKFKETKSVLNKKKPLRRSKSHVRYRFCSLQRRQRGKKGKAKLRKSIKLAMKVSHAEKLPGILSDLKIHLHYLASSFAQDMAPSDTFTQTTIMRKEKPDFATELGIVVSEKENSTQEGLIDDFLKSLVSTWFIFPTIRNGLQSVILLPTGLQLYFERLLRGPPPEERERMSYEWLRLQTFINYPASAPGSGIRLARAGFYYSGNGTVTVCYACGGQHSGWNFHDDPYEIHRRISPDCPFLRGNLTYPNVPIMQDGAQNGIQMGNNTSNMPISPSSSNGTSGTPHSAASQTQISAVTQVGLQPYAANMSSIHSLQDRGSDQQVSEQNFLEVENSLGIVPHSINSTVIDQPVLLTAAVVPKTIGECQERQSPTTVATTSLAAQCAQRNNSNTTPTSVTNLSSGAISMTCIQSVLEPSTQLGEPGHIRDPNENEITNRLINEMGYQRETVREVILEVKRRKGRQEIVIEHVIELLIADEERRVRASRQSEASVLQELIQESTPLTLRDDSHPSSAIPPATARTRRTTQPSQSCCPMNQVTGGRAAASNILSSSLPQEPTSQPALNAESHREDYLWLRDQLLCKICMERTVELTFLPCGHLVCCEVCGQTLRFCPICRAKIHASVKTYLS